MKFSQIQTRRKTLGDSVYNAIREAITSLKLEPGQMVYENELATSLGVSRTPIREAFRLLVAEELIEILPQRGARIAFISEDKVKEARFVRESLEVSAFKKVAEQWDALNERCQKTRDNILRILEEQKQAAEEKDFTQFLVLDESYHQAVLQQAGNATLLNVIYQMRGHLNRMRMLELRKAKHTQFVLSEHQGIFEAIMANDVNQTEKLLIMHLRRLENEVSQVLEKYSHYFLKV